MTEQPQGTEANPLVKTKKKKSYPLPTGVLGIGLSYSEDRIFAACMDGVYELFPNDGTHRRLYEHQSYAASVASLPDQTTLMSAGYDGVLQWYDTNRQSVFRRIQAHRFWSWQMVLSPNGKYAASSTGQYLAGGEKYEPRAEKEPSVKLFDVKNGQLCQQWSHTPPVQSVAFSSDSRYVAAGNLMGEVRVWDVESGDLLANWTTDAFTSWGIIKSHCYIGGIYSLAFSPDSQHLLLAGMGPMRDPMAGNGRQLWQRFSWQESTPKLVDQTHDGQSGEGLMETLAIHPAGKLFIMGGRLRGGKWNAALFSLQDGNRLDSLNTGYRMTGACFNQAGNSLFTCGSDKQPKPKNGKWKPFGVVDIYDLV